MYANLCRRQTILMRQAATTIARNGYFPPGDFHPGWFHLQHITDLWFVLHCGETSVNAPWQTPQSNNWFSVLPLFITESRNPVQDSGGAGPTVQERFLLATIGPDSLEPRI